MAAKGILFGGTIAVDHVKLLDVYPVEGCLSLIRAEHRSTGGLVCNNCINLRILDPELSVGAMGRIGDDSDGRFVLSQLESYGVQTNGVKVDPNCPTSYTDVMTVEATGRRTFFFADGAGGRWCPEDVDARSIAESYGYAQLGYQLLLPVMDQVGPDGRTNLGRVFQALQEAGVMTALDMVSRSDPRLAGVVRASLPWVDDLIINEIEAALASGVTLRDEQGKPAPEGWFEAPRRLLALGVHRLVVIHAPEGSVGLERDGGFCVVPSHVVHDEEIKGTVGAGDAYSSGIVYGMTHGWSLVRAMRLATAMGAMSLFSPTTTGGARPLPDVLAFMEARAYRSDFLSA